MSSDINYKHLYYFWTVAHEGSIAKASEKLHITPQTISGQLTLLQEKIGSPLFEKIGRGLSITETGKLVLSYADEIFSLGKELSKVLRGSPNVGAADFIVSAASALPKTIVYKIIEPALRLPHQISLTCKEGPVQNILADLAVHETDLVLSDTPVSSHFSIKAYNHFLGESHLAVFASSKLAKKFQKKFPQSLNNAPLLLPTQQYAIRQRIDRWLEENQIYPKTQGQFDDSALVKSFGQSGFGIFFMPSVIEKEVCHNFDVKVIGHLEEVKQQFYAISPERRVHHPAVAAICDSAREEVFVPSSNY